jgi:hypothetical protein
MWFWRRQALSMEKDQTMNDVNQSIELDTPSSSAPPLQWQLAVLSGLHAGALVDVSADDWTLLGSAEDCDIVLRDPGVLPHHAALFPRGASLQLRAIEGALSALELERAPGGSVALTDASTWQVRSVTLGVGVAGSAAWQALLDRPFAAPAETGVAAEQAMPSPVERTTVAEFADDGSAADDSPAAARKRAPRTLTRRAQQVIAGAAACVLLTATGAVAWGVAGHKAQARETGSAISGILSGLDMPELRIIEAANGHQRIEGTVRSESERGKLMSALQRRGIYPAVDVVTGEHLAASVQNTFRQRGLHVKAQYTGAGRVEVQGAAPSALTEKAVQDVLTAINAVTQVALLDAAAVPPESEPRETVLPAVPAATATVNNSVRDPKRVVGVVGGATPFVVTQDRRHYFVGSMLPDGTQVDQIEGHTVVFSRQGKPTTVSF